MVMSGELFVSSASLVAVCSLVRGPIIILIKKMADVGWLSIRWGKT